MFYPLRRLRLKIENNRKYKFLRSLGVKPYRCQGCGDGWAEFEIEEPTEPEGTNNTICVCENCVGFYDYKCTRERLYINPTDWRDVTGNGKNI